MRFKAGLALAVALIAAVASARLEGILLRHTPKEGDSISYKLEGHFDAGGANATLTSSTVVKIIKVDSDGTFTQQVDAKGGEVSVKGANIPGGEMTFPSPPTTKIYVYKNQGELMEIRGEEVQPASYRLDRLNSVYMPDKEVNIGDSWSKELKADPKLGTVTVKADFKLVGEEKVGTYDTYRIEATSKETEGSDAGTVKSTHWLNKIDGSVVKVTSEYSNVTVPGAPAPISGTFKMDRTPS